MNGRYNNDYGRNGYSPNRGYQGGNRGGQRRNNGNQRNGDYKPNSGNIRENRDRQNQNAPDYKGVMNVEVDGRTVTFFVSGWWNENGSMGLKFTNVAEAGQNQGRPQQRGNGRPQERYQGGNGYGQRDDYQPRQNGAMSRARDLQEPVYRDEGPYDAGPPPQSYPDGPDYDEQGGPPY